MSSNRRVMEVSVDPDDFQNGNHLPEQAAGDGHSQTPEGERSRLDQDVVVGDGAALAEDLRGPGDDLFVPPCVAIQKCQQRRGVDESQTSDASARYSSWRSARSDTPDAPAPAARNARSSVGSPFSRASSISSAS